jgi:hypothetical protein
VPTLGEVGQLALPEGERVVVSSWLDVESLSNIGLHIDEHLSFGLSLLSLGACLFLLHGSGSLIQFLFLLLLEIIVILIVYMDFGLIPLTDVMEL